MNLNDRKHQCCRTINAVEKHLCNSYCDRDHTKHLRKTQELKEKGDEESLKLLRDDPLVGMPIDCRFSFPKQTFSTARLKIVQKVVVINNTHTFKCSVEVVTKRNDKWLVAHPPHFIKS